VSVLPGPEPVPTERIAPSGVVTFLFSGIEGSTVRWERDRVAMQEALRRHDALMRAAIVENGGFVFKTIGDAFCAAFNRAGEALDAALAGQQALQAEDFSAVDGVRVRMALHSGESDQREGDYFGPAVNRVARLLAVGHGGQVLVSGMTADLLRGLLPPETGLLDLGSHRLKDLAEPERVSQLLAPTLAVEFPALRSLDILANNLPVSLTSFVGRETEIAEITALLEKHRLVTLVGSGGVGKSRTSLQVAANHVDRFTGGVWFVELAPLSDASYVPSTIAQAANLPLGSSGEPLEALVQAIASKSMLLVLDNCEHIVDGTARALAAILRACANVRILASSRQALGIAGEAAYRMPSLPLDTSAALFAERARAVDRGFALTGESAVAVAEICRRLDGIPLAIELAAARVKILSPQQIHSRLDQRFRVLTGGSRDVLPRQQTLRSLIDWSYDLLDEPERTLFRRLSIFVDGFTLEGATAVCSGADLDEFDIFDLLASLVDKSLVLAETASADVRYRLLESTRAYASEKLDAAHEREAVSGKHLDFLVALFVQARQRFDTTMRNDELSDPLRAELDGVRAALDSALTGSRATQGANLVGMIGEAWCAWGLEREGIQRARAYIDVVPATETNLLRRLWSTVARLSALSYDGPNGLEAASKELEYARCPGVTQGSLAGALGTYSGAASRMGLFDEAEAALSEAQALPNLPAIHQLSLQIDRALLLDRRGDFAGAAKEFERIWRANMGLGNSFSWGMAFNLANAEAQCGKHRRSIEIIDEVLPTIRSTNDQQYYGRMLTVLASYRRVLGDHAGAASAAREAVEDYVARKLESIFVVASIEELALSCALDGDPSAAAILSGYVAVGLPERGNPEFDFHAATQRRLREELEKRLAPSELARLRAEGEQLSMLEASVLALNAGA
jgi:predicted ATPase/class 3 adenylate cyclase